MANKVFANGMEIACKAAVGKVIAAFPDVCMTPPENPATPPGVPVPYPNTAMASDTTDGSKKVKISDKEIMLKNKSCFKTSTGDEAGSAAKKGLISSKNKGKVYFIKWSMDVKVEGENVDRHLDMTTNNHGSPTANEGIPWLYSDTMDSSKVPDGCKQEANKFNKECGKHVKRHKDKSMNVAGTGKAMCGDKECRKARKCILTPKKLGCCHTKTAHHVIPDSQFKGIAKYDYHLAPCICATGNSHHTKDHGRIHTKLNNLTVNHAKVVGKVVGKTIQPGASWSVADSADAGAQAASEVTKCKKKCIEAQTLQGHKDQGIVSNRKITPTTAGSVTKPPKPPPAQGYP